MYLRSNVVWGATECPGLVSIFDALFAEPKVSNLDMAISIQHHVVQFEVTIDDP